MTPRIAARGVSGFTRRSDAGSWMAMVPIRVDPLPEAEVLSEFRCFEGTNESRNHLQGHCQGTTYVSVSLRERKLSCVSSTTRFVARVHYTDRRCGRAGHTL
jgi:hypothetical protein